MLTLSYHKRQIIYHYQQIFMKSIRTLLAFLMLTMAGLTVQASHIIGGEIYYVCTGPNTYTVTLVLYRDCTSFTGFDNPAYLGVYDEDGNLIDNVPMSPPDIIDIPIEVDNPCLVVPPGLCIEQAIYVEEITLPDDGQTYDLVYQRCCRNAGIVNIEIPDDTGSTYWQQIPPGEDAECNNSPVFNNYPPSVICVSDPINFDHSATDPDGDSLAYKFYTPYAGASPFDPAPSPPPPPPYDPVDWETGYDITYPIDASPAFAIDVNTGLLTGTATDEGRYVFGVVVEEWRDGVLLGEHIRDFQFNVELCEPTIESVLGVEGSVVDDYYLDCTDFTINFNNYSSGADDYLWLFGDGTTSTAFEPVHVYPDTGVYTVSLICNPGFVCADTFSSDIWIYNTLTADFDYNAGCSGEAVVFTDASVSTEAGIINVVKAPEQVVEVEIEAEKKMDEKMAEVVAEFQSKIDALASEKAALETRLAEIEQKQKEGFSAVLNLIEEVTKMPQADPTEQPKSFKFEATKDIKFERLNKYRNAILNNKN